MNENLFVQSIQRRMNFIPTKKKQGSSKVDQEKISKNKRGLGKKNSGERLEGGL